MTRLLRIKLPVVARITLGLVGLLTSVLMMLSYLQLQPDPQADALRHRKQFCETAAIGFALLAERTDAQTMRKYLDSLAKRTDDVQSMGVRREDGKLVVENGKHAQNWRIGRGVSGSDSQIWVKFYSNGKPWGTFEAVFKPSTATSQLSFLGRPEAAHGTLAVLACAVAFYVYLRVVLRHLNPSQVVPNRVRDALDTLAEGLLILDRDERIVLANRAFEKATATSSEQLLGSAISVLPLELPEGHSGELTPWQEAIRDSKPVKGRLMSLGGDQGDRTFLVSAAPILDEKGVSRGILASFEDVTQLEEKKRELTGLVACLRESSEVVKQQNRELEKLATRDPLTECLNRRSFFERFESEWAKIEQDQPLCAMMIDIDFFKSINDNYGHGMGDEVLRQVAGTLRRLVRDSDIVCRYGGEEFAVLLPDTDLDQAAIAAEHLCSSLGLITFPQFKVTVSIGVAEYSAATNQPQELLDQADKCLYVAKRTGRNRVVRWDEVPAETVIDESQIKRTPEAKAPEPILVPYHAVTALISALAFRDQGTAAHSRRVADLCVCTAEGLLSLKDCYLLEVAALLHDIGKIGVPDHLLLKPGAFTPEEWEIIRCNDRNGKEIIRASFASPTLTAIVENYQSHYARTDGKPQTLTGADIPVGARILAIADAYDAMVTDRVFRKKFSEEEALAELQRCAGTQFDPELVERFVAMIHERPAPEQSPADIVSKETALEIGLQIERLSEVLDEQDLDALDAMSRRLELTALKYGATSVEAKACELKNILDSERELQAILQAANELLELCRSTQQSFLKSHAEATAS